MAEASHGRGSDLMSNGRGNMGLPNNAPHPYGGGLQPQVEMGPFLMAFGEPRRRNGEPADDYWGS